MDRDRALTPTEGLDPDGQSRCAVIAPQSQILPEVEASASIIPTAYPQSAEGVGKLIAVAFCVTHGSALVALAKLVELAVTATLL